MRTSRRDFTSTLFFTSGIAALGAHSRLIANPILATPEKMQGLYPLKNDKEAFKISIFSKHLQWLDYKGMAKVLSEIGFDGTDLTLRPGGHVLPERA
jgi:L-ribulose-5-phosphate 3-epimerase